MNFRSRRPARVSSSVSCSRVPTWASASRRGSALSSIASLQSSATSSPVLGHDQWIDLDKLGVVAGVDCVEAEQGIDQLFTIAGQIGRQRAFQFKGAEPFANVDGQPHQLTGMRGRNLFDIHAAARREQQQRSLGRGIVQDGCIQLARNRHLRFDQQLLDAMPGDAHADDGGCGGLRFGGTRSRA